MTPFSEPFLAHLGGEATTVCHCWRVTRADGVALGFTDHDRPLTVNGTSFEPGAGLTASEARVSLGLGADTQDVAGALRSEAIDEADILAGRYDGAAVETLLVNWAAPDQFAVVRRATIGRLSRADGRFTAELDSLGRALDQPAGRRYARLCDAELGDQRCGFDLGASGFSGNGTVLAIDAVGTLTVDGLGAFADGWFSNGRLTWTAGARSGLTDRIRTHRAGLAAATMTLWGERTGAIAVGDPFAVIAGCDKRFATCRSKFDNGVNFRGFPHLPGNDAAYGYAVDGGVFDGGALVP